MMIDPKEVKRKSAEEKIRILLDLEIERKDDQGDAEPYDELYLALMDDKDPEVRTLSIYGLWDYPYPEYIDPLIERAEKDDDVEVRAEACHALGRYIYEGFVVERLDAASFGRARNFLLQTVKDNKEPSLVRRCALESLGYDTGSDIVKLIWRAYRHSDPEFKSSAIICMGRAGTDYWADRIIKELDSPNKDHKTHAICAASEACIEGATPKLRALAMSKDKDIRIDAIFSLGAIGGPGALEILELCAISEDPQTREVARETIELYRECEDMRDDCDEFDSEWEDENWGGRESWEKSEFDDDLGGGFEEDDF